MPAYAGQSLTIQGRVANSFGQPITGTAVQFRVQILTPNTNRCILYDETQTLDLSQTSGLFTINLNDSSGTRTATLPTTFSLEQAVSNRLSFPVNSSFCANGSGTVVYSPTFDANRKVVIQFKDPSSMSSFETIPEMDLNPMAYAMDSTRVGGYTASSLLRVVDGTTPGNPAPFSSAQFTELQNLIGGSSTSYMSTTSGSTTGAQLPLASGNPASPSTGSIWFDTTGSGALKYYDSTGTIRTVGTGTGSGTITEVVAGTGLSGGGSTGSVTLALGTSGVSAASYGSASAVPVLTVDAYGRITSASTTAITGTLPSGTAGQFLRSDGTAWTSQAVKMADIKNAAGTADLFSSPSCTAAQSLYWDSGTDEIKCQNIAINASAITAGTIADARLADVGTAGTYRSVTTDAKGRVTAGTNPTTLSGYAITDAVQNAAGVPSITAGLDAAIGSAGTAGRLFIATDSLKIYRDNGTTWDVIASAAGSGGDITEVNAGTGLSGGGTSGPVTLDLSNVGTAGTYAKVTTDAQGRVTAGTALSASDIPTLDWAKIGTGKPTDLAGYGITDAVKNAGGTVSFNAGLASARPAAPYVAGRFYVATDTKVISYDNGAAWVDLTQGSSAIAAIAVTAPIINNGTATSPDIGISQASGSTSGYLSSSDWTTFSNKLSTALNSALIWVGNGSNVATPVAPSGDVSLANTGAFTVNGIKTQAISAQGAAAGQVLRYAGSNTWTPNFVTMADLRSTVTGTSAITGNCTASQTLTWNSGTDSLQCQSISVAAGTQVTGVLPVANGGTGVSTTSQNFVFAGPTSGSGAPDFRALTSADLPASASYWQSATGGINYAGGGSVGIGTGTPGAMLDVNGQAIAIRGATTSPGELRLSTGPSTGTNYVGFKGPATNPASNVLWQLPAADGTNGYVLSTNGSGALSWISPTTGSLTSVGLTGPGGIFSVTGSPLTSNGAMTLSASGTSGGIPYFSSASALSSSAALSSNGIVIGGGAGAAPTSIAAVASGRILASAGTSSAPAYTTTPTLGAVGAGGTLALAGSTSGAVTIQPQAAAGTYNFNLPTSAGTAGQALLSGGGGSTAMTWGAIGVGAGGTGLTSGTQGGMPYFASSSTMASTAAGATGNVMTSNGSSAPAWGALNLAGGSNYVSGVLPVANGGTGAATLTAAGVFQNGGNSFGAAASIGTNDSNSLTLKTNNAAAVTVLANGNVGIGTTAPSKALEVVGDVQAVGSSTNGNVYISNVGKQQTWGLVSNQGANGGFTLWDATNAKGPFQVAGNSPSNTLVVANTGNVGIGTTTPGTSLDVVAASDGSDVIRAQTNSAAGTMILRPDGANGNTLRFGGGGPMAGVIRFVGPGNAERMRIDAANNFGLANMAPTNILDVSPGYYYAGTASQSGNTVTGVGTSWSASMVGSSVAFANGVNAGVITAVPNATTLTVSTSQTVASQSYSINNLGLNVTNTGAVGIGTTAPVQALDVNGSIHLGSPVHTGATSYGVWSATDFVLYNKDRCRSDGVGGTDPAGYCEGLGRALVHEANDILHINYNGDYDGGILLGGSLTTVSGKMGIGMNTPGTSLDFGNSHATGKPGNYATGAPGGTNRNDVINVWSSGESRYGLGIHTGTLEMYTAGANSLQFGSRSTDGNGTFTPQMSIGGTNGYVGVGTTSPNYKLEVIGDIRASGNLIANATTYSSDVRWKQNIEPLRGSLERLSRLKGVSYYWRQSEFPEMNFNDRKQIGLIAQDVEKEFPELVLTNKAGFKSVNYAALVAPIIQALQELAHQAIGTEERVAYLEAENARLKAADEAKTRQIASLKADSEAKSREIASVKADSEAKNRDFASLRSAVCEINPKAKVCASR